MKKDLGLVVLAAGMGSRYGGLKQVDSFGPNGEGLLEYAIYDSIEAGFKHIVFVIREEIEIVFKEKFGDMLKSCPKVSFVYQEFDPVFEGIDVVKREKPWGTLHAVLSAKDVISGPFGVINADDRYGKSSYKELANSLENISSTDAVLVGYTLNKTLSKHGTVNRGICKVENGVLKDVEEHYAIHEDQGVIIDQSKNRFTGDETVSMNFWGFHESVFELLQKQFDQFVLHNTRDPRVEAVLPLAIDDLIKSGKISCSVIDSSASWHGVTNPNDKPIVQKALDGMMKRFLYPQKLR